MVPAIKPGDIIFTTKPTYLSPKKGDVVVYTPRRLDGTPVADFAHRIIGGDATSGWIVKGDANPNPDDQRPKINDIVGVVIFTIPFIGKFLTPQMLSLVLLFAFAIWLILDAFRAPE
jgi:signal peptidase